MYTILLNGKETSIGSGEHDEYMALVYRGEEAMCEVVDGDWFVCTRSLGHNGPHVAHGEGVCAVWEAEDEVP